MRGDTARLNRCRGAGGNTDKDLPRIRPFQYVTQRDIVFYAHFCHLDYFAVECPYAGIAFRGHPRELIKELERVQPTAVLDVVRSGEMFVVQSEKKQPSKNKQGDHQSVRPCERCGEMTSQKLCQACALIDKLNYISGRTATITPPPASADSAAAAAAAPTTPPTETTHDE